MKSPWFIAGIGLVYAWIAYDLAREHDWGHSIMFVGYALANVGLTWAVLTAIAK